ncbi:MAG: hypothetical protein QM820_04140 [Minicystis sp.]
MVSRDGVRRLITVRRTPRPYGTAAEVESAFQALEAVLTAQDRRTSSLLIDMCAAPFRADPEIDAAAASHPRRFVALGFSQIAVLARTAAGRVQAQRFFRERGFDIPVLTDEREAMAFLTLPPSSRAPISDAGRGPISDSGLSPISNGSRAPVSESGLSPVSGSSRAPASDSRPDLPPLSVGRRDHR